MFRTVKWAAAPLLALAVMFNVSTKTASAADDSAAKGTVSGTVVGADDKPVSGTLVRLFHPMEKGERKGAKSDAKAEKKSDGSDTKAAGEKGAKGDKGDKPVPVATATTDKDGKFEMKDVPVGKYMVMANVR